MAEGPPGRDTAGLAGTLAPHRRWPSLPSAPGPLIPHPPRSAAGRRSASIGWLPMRIWKLAPVAAPSVTRAAVIVTVLPMSRSRPVPGYRLSPWPGPCGPNATAFTGAMECARPGLSPGSGGRTGVGAGAGADGPEPAAAHSASGPPAYSPAMCSGLAWLSAVTAALPGPVWGSCMSRYPTELIVSMMATTPKVSMNAGWWCHAVLGCPGGSSRLGGETGAGTQWIWSCFPISGPGSAPTTSAMVIGRWSSSRRSVRGREATSRRS